MKAIEVKEFGQYLEELNEMVGIWKEEGQPIAHMRTNMLSLLLRITDTDISFTVGQLQRIFELI